MRADTAQTRGARTRRVWLHCGGCDGGYCAVAGLVGRGCTCPHTHLHTEKTKKALLLNSASPSNKVRDSGLHAHRVCTRSLRIEDLVEEVAGRLAGLVACVSVHTRRVRQMGVLSCCGAAGGRVRRRGSVGAGHKRAARTAGTGGHLTAVRRLRGPRSRSIMLKRPGLRVMANGGTLFCGAEVGRRPLRHRRPQATVALL